MELPGTDIHSEIKAKTKLCVVDDLTLIWLYSSMIVNNRRKITEMIIAEERAIKALENFANA